MYTSKQARPSSVNHQVANVLLRALAERHGPLGGHSANVSKLARRTAQELDVGEETLQAIGLAGEQIPLGARIILACDAYDAMISDRSYRAALCEAGACAELQRHAGTQFDPRVVDAMLSSCLPGCSPPA